MKHRIDMNDPRGSKLLPGLILVGIGLFALFGTLGLVFGRLFGALIMGGLAYYFYREGTRTGRLALRLMALPLAGLALSALLPWNVGGAFFLALIGLAFALVWRTEPARWWAIIPAGTFASLAAVAGLGGLLGRADGFVFLGGLAATFYALTRLPRNAQAWALWPAGGLAVVALLSLTGGGGWLVPLVLIGAGLAVLARGGFGGRAPERHAEGAARPEQSLVRAEAATGVPAPVDPAAPRAPVAPPAAAAPQPAANASEPQVPADEPPAPQG